MAIDRLKYTPDEEPRDVPNDESLRDLVRSQIQFGLTYAGEARKAYAESRGEYAETAMTIAVNSYSSATRLAARLLPGTYTREQQQLIRLSKEIEALQPGGFRPREIA
ncbi:MAG: hypothetical protein JOY54_09575 [Acidobacteriaceae bacterium]|nr:hypothetical protein [Acidobacteriaceae bacterium]